MRKGCFILVLVSLAVLVNTQGQGIPWKMHVIDQGQSGADGVRLADVNKDGLLDITTGWEEAGITKVYFHPGHEKVNDPWPSVVVGKTPSVEDAVFIDLDLDGNMDVVSCTEGKSKRVYVSWAPKGQKYYLDPGKWNTDFIPSSDGLMQWMYAIPMDVDGKNGIDIVAGAKGPNARIGWFESPEDPLKLDQWVWHPLNSCGWIMSLFTRDVDHDGDLDIVTSDRRGKDRGVRWLENPGHDMMHQKEWKSHPIGAMDREVMFMDLADVDGDQLVDALVTEYSNQKMVVMRSLDTSGLRWEEHEIVLPEISGRAKSVRVGDIDLDGVTDIVHSSNTLKAKDKEGILWFSRNEKNITSSWEYQRVSGKEGYKFDRLELIDLDGDGDLDVLTCEENFGKKSEGLGVIWYENPVH